MKKTIFTVPNLLSFFRLCLIPLIVIAYLREHYREATILLVISGLTDTLDGFIARHFHQISDFGKLIDPLADKLTLAAVVFALLFRHTELLITMGVLVVKESLSLIAAYILYHRGVRPSESKLFGKLSTLSLYFSAFVIMLIDLLEVSLGHVIMAPWIIWSLVGLTCLCMILAMFQYYPIYIGIIRGSYNIETEQFEGDSAK